MKAYHEIHEALSHNKNVLLLTSWRTEESNQPMEIIQTVKEWDPALASEEWEKEVASQGKPVIIEANGMTTMAEPFYPEERLIVLGGGHVALPVVEFAARCGFSVTVVDDRPEFANEERFPWAKEVVCAGFEEAIRQLKPTHDDYVCVIPRGHRFDTLCLRAVLECAEPGYYGMIGSRRHVAVVKDQLLSEGFPQEVLDRLHSPIGLKIGGITPAEIAISIVAELISAKRQGRGSKGLRHQSDLDYEVVEALAKETKEPMAVLTVIRSEGSSPRGAGAKMIAYADGRMLGSIGGGGGEAIMLKKARDMIGTGSSMVAHIEMNAQTAYDEGMVCGGNMDVLIQDVSSGK